MPRAAAVVRYQGARGVVWRIKYADADGRQVMETLGPERDGWDRRKAEAELRERLVKVERKGWRKPAPLTFADYSAVWFEEAQKRRSWRPSSVRAYRNTLRHLDRAFGPLPLASVRPRHVAAYVSASTLAPNTVNVHLSVLHDIFESAVRDELVDGNPARRAERPKRPRRRERILAPDETRAVVRAYDELLELERSDRDRQYLAVHRAAFLTLILTGVRQHELRALRWRDVDLIENVLRVADSKTEEGVRSIALSPALAEELWQHRRRSPFQGDDERVFCDPRTGGPYGVERHRKALENALTRAGLEGRVRPFHDLRHTAITQDAASGSSEIAVMAKAGHRSMATTRRYLHLAGVVFREEAARLEARLLDAQPSTRSSTHLSESQSTSQT